MVKYKRNSCKEHQKAFSVESHSDKIFNYNKADWKYYQTCLPIAAPIQIINDVDKLNKFIVESFLTAAKSAIPLKQKNNQQKNMKSLPAYILQLIKKRKYFKKKMKKENFKENKTKFNVLTKAIRDEINSLKNAEWNAFLNKQGRNPINSKPFWQRIGKLKGKKINNSIPTLKTNNNIYESEEDKANLFAENLKRTFSDQNDPRFDEKFKLRVENYVVNHDFDKHQYNNKECFTLKDLNIIIRNLKNHSAPGQDKIHNQMIKNSHAGFRRIILHLINLTVKKSQLPSEWKSSIITMIPKKTSNSNDPKDYRPISLTSNIAKIAEKMIAFKLKDYLKEKNIIIKQQSGFRNNRQTKDNICFMSQKIKENFNRGKSTCGIFFDIASAFDKVWHKGLLYKLIKHKIPNYIICWLKNFLENRCFVVRIGTMMSVTNNISAGVPQGAALSPILFSIFINDIPLRHKKNRDYGLLFADDLVSLNIFKKYGNVQKHINKYLKKIEKWLTSWRLMMAPQKCNFIIFTQNCKQIEKIDLHFFNSTITLTENTTFLGIRFDKRLTFNTQIKYLQDSCINRLNFLKVVSKRSFGLSIATLNQIYISLIRSIIEYSSIIYPIISTTNFKKLNIIQNKAIKIINRKPLYSSIANIDTTICNLYERFDLLNLKYFEKALDNNNELIQELWQDFKLLTANLKFKQQSILCKYKDSLLLANY